MSIHQLVKNSIYQLIFTLQHQNFKKSFSKLIFENRKYYMNANKSMKAESLEFTRLKVNSPNIHFEGSYQGPTP